MLHKKQDKLHLLQGLKKILLDIDKAVKIIRETDSDAEVVPNLMIGFGIDDKQAEFVAEIKLRNINKEYILKRVDEVDSLEAEIADLRDTLDKPARVKKILIDELSAVRKKYAVPRRTEILYDTAEEGQDEEEEIPGLSCDGVPLPGGVFQEDHPPVSAHEQRAEVQGGATACSRPSRPRTAPRPCSSPTSARSTRPA